VITVCLRGGRKMLYGYVGQILRVDLTTGSAREEALPSEDVLKDYMGCWGLALKYLYDECPPGISPVDAECPLIFFNGPFTGTRFSGGNNITLATLNFDTGYTVGRSHTHANFGPLLKGAGYDGLIIVGKAKSPVYLWIHNHEVELRDAQGIWGSDTHESEDLIKAELKEPKVSVAAIGPAGENLCAGAMIMNDKNHGFCHSGTGAVMGSKNLKAIAVYGNKEIAVADPERVKIVADRWRKDLNFGPKAPFQTVGWKTKIDYRHEYYKRALNRYGGICALNMKASLLDGFIEGYRNKITPRPCHGCAIGCTYDVEIAEGPHKGYVASLSGGAEAIEGAASMVGVTDPGTVYRLVDLYDRFGAEGSAVGCIIAMAFEAYERGLITKRDTNGLELRWGDAKAAEELLLQYVHREGLGDILARGIKEAAEIIGGDSPNFAVHVKGTGISLHDWRHAWGIMLGQILGSGAGWTSPSDGMRAETAAGYPNEPTWEEKLDPWRQPQSVAATGNLKQLNDSTGLCWFSSWGLPNIMDLLRDGLHAITGLKYESQELWEIGERVNNLERAFNIRHGLTPEDDLDVSPRLTESPPDGPGKGKSIKPYLPGMVHEYYRLMGWDRKTGRPLISTLKRLGLDYVIHHMWGNPL
jgi:aldehyde:ferredoxin oxidoreductase